MRYVQRDKESEMMAGVGMGLLSGFRPYIEQLVGSGKPSAKLRKNRIKKVYPKVGTLTGEFVVQI
jgi:hypothetical protein